jgi:hypothetical protein
MTCAECQKGKKTILAVISYILCVCGLCLCLTFAAVTSPFFGFGRCFCGRGDVYMCAFACPYFSCLFE